MTPTDRTGREYKLGNIFAFWPSGKSTYGPYFAMVTNIKEGKVYAHRLKKSYYEKERVCKCGMIATSRAIIITDPPLTKEFEDMKQLKIEIFKNAEKVGITL